MINGDFIRKLELENFGDYINYTENQYLNLIYHPLFDKVVTRDEYDRSRELMEWECAICGKKIFINRRKYDVENFVCEKCKETHNNKNTSIDIRILNSRTKLYKYLEERLYQELEDSLNKGKREVN